MRKNRILFTILSIFLFYSCESEKDILDNDSPVAVQFFSEINNREIKNKAFDSSWENEDKIGVYMKKPEIVLSDQSIINGAKNKIYKTSGNGLFTADSEEQIIYYPQDNSSVAFIAYYPYQNNIDNYIYKIDVTDQSIPQEIDLLYSNNITAAGSSNPSNSLYFTHQLSKINLNVKTSDNIPYLNGLQIKVSGLKTLADFNLADASLYIDDNSIEDIFFKTTITGNSAFAEAIIIPDEGGANRIITFYLPDVGTFKWEIPTETKLRKGQKNTYNITLNAEGIIIDPDYGWVETPLMNDLSSDLTYVTHMMPENTNIRNYSMLYDTKYKLAYWVAYPLHSYYIGSSGRTDAWGYDPQINQAFQAYLKSGYGISGIDRGHQIPSADRTSSRNANATTFYYTNMTPQNSNLNQQMWARLETKVRNWTAVCDTLYVVTGAMITTSNDNIIEYVNDNSGKQVAKPKYYYKALAQRKDDIYYTIAFKMDNKSYNTGEDYNKYRITVDNLEQETGFVFFPSIPKEKKNNIDTSKWN